jgi:hypothetical protein
MLTLVRIQLRFPFVQSAGRRFWGLIIVSTQEPDDGEDEAAEDR